MSPLSLEQQLSILASLAQVIQAVVVIVGIPLVFLQVRQMRTERRHRQWEALGWALSLLQQETEEATLIFRERHDAQPHAYTHTDEAARNLLAHLSGNLTVVQIAVEHNYVDRDLLFTSIGPNLARLHMLVVAAKHDKTPFASLAATFSNFPGIRLLESARVWHDATTPRPGPSISQVMKFGPNEAERPE